MASLAIGHVRDVLAAAEAAAQQVVNERGLFVGREMGEQFAFEPAGKVGAWLGGSDVEFREVLSLLAHRPSFKPTLRKARYRSSDRIAAVECASQMIRESGRHSSGA